MKKVISLVLVLVMCLSLCACGEKGDNVVVKEVKDYRFTLDVLQDTFCGDDGAFTVSGTTAITHDWDFSNFYDRVITAEIADETKVSSITMEYTDLDTKAYKSSEILRKFLKGDTGELSAGNVLKLMPLYDLKDMMMLVGAEDSEITVELISNLVEKGTSFEKNNWTVSVDIDDSSVTFTAEYSTVAE